MCHTCSHYIHACMQVSESSDDVCSQVSEYSGEVCGDELISLQMCFSDVTSPPPALNIPSSIDQQTGESTAISLVNGLPLLNPSQKCTEDIMPFLCLYIFSLCDSSNTLHTILRQDCLDIRDDVCAREWSQAIAFLGGGVLPVCEDLPDDITMCSGAGEYYSTKSAAFWSVCAVTVEPVYSDHCMVAIERGSCLTLG